MTLTYREKLPQLFMKTILLLCFVGLSALIIFTLHIYSGKWYVYLVFTAVSNALLLNGFKRRALFFDTFIGIFLWLGFWLKFSLRTILGDAHFTEANSFNGSPEALDTALIVSSCGLSAFLLVSWVRQFIFTYPKGVISCVSSGLFLAYQKFRIQILVAFITFVFIVAISNIFLGIYQRGMVAQTILPYGLNGIYKWLLQFGLASISALIIRYEIELNRNLNAMAVVPAILETFMSNVSLLSRGMVLNSAGLAFGAWRLLISINARVSIYRIGAASIIFILIFITSIYTVNYLRATAYYENLTGSLPNSKILTSQIKSMTMPLFIDRWVGVEGVVSVSSSPDLGWSIWREAWQERFLDGELSLYDKKFINSPYKNLSERDTPIFHFVSLPGIVAFLYYPGSLVFLFFALMLSGICAAGLEIFVYKYAGENLILCSLIAQVVAYRYAHFGYVPAQSYLLFGTIIMNIVIFIVAEYALRRCLHVPAPATKK